VTLSIVKADGLDPLIALERPGKARRRILAAGKQHQGGVGIERDHGASRVDLKPRR
jgi:hypothetical protein